MKRRLTTILAADIVGFSRLTAADEEGTVTRLRQLRAGLIDRTIAAHGGRLFKSTGDGVLVEFGSVVDAARAAVAIQQGMAAAQPDLPPERRLVLRIGINLGDVVVEATASISPLASRASPRPAASASRAPPMTRCAARSSSRSPLPASIG